jgi:hypothetical protein
MPLDQRKSSLTVSALFLAVAVLGFARIGWQMLDPDTPPGAFIILAVPTIASLVLSVVYWSKRNRTTVPDNPPLERTGHERKL